MSQELQRGEVELRPATLAIMSDAEIDRAWRIAEALAKSGLFPDVRDAAAAFAKMLVGADLGMSPTHALTGVHMVEGKPQLASTTLAGFVRRSESYEYEVGKHDESTCEIEFLRLPSGDTVGVSTFSIADAKKANLGGWPDEAKWARSNWGKYPKNMLFARAMSNGVRWHAPDLFGGVPVYTEADEFTVRSSLTSPAEAGQLGEPLDLGDDVEAVLARATTLGHVGLADRAAAEMALASQDAQVSDAWVERANAELDEYAGGVVARKRAEAEQRRSAANEMRANENEAEAQFLEAQASELDREAAELEEALSEGA